MRYDLRIGVLFAVAVVVDSSFAVAQGTGSFNRVTTAGVRRGAAPSTSRAANVARSNPTPGVAGAAAYDDSLRPYSNRPSVRGDAPTGGVPRHSTQPEQPVAKREVIPQSRGYFPGMRASRVIQQPVTLTARSAGVRHICTPSRSQMVGAGGAHR
jgi:hypothetical protein